MKGKEDLFHLVQAMSPSEKRYFTLDAQKSNRKGNRYLELFQVINEMEEYDEEMLRLTFPRSLPFDKAYLYDAILRSMRDYHSARSRSARIKERLLDARYLFERGLYDQCEVRLEEAKQMADELGDHLALLDLNKEFRRLTLATKRRGFEEALVSLAAEERGLRSALEEEFTFLGVYEQLVSRVIRQFQLRGEPEKQAFLQEFSKLGLEQESLPATPLARLRFHQSRALVHQLLGDFSQMMHDFSRVVEWWEEHPKYKEEEFYRYIIDFSNLLHAFASNGQMHRLPQLIEQLEGTEPDSETARRILFQKVAIYRLIAYINLGITKDLDKLVSEIRTGLDTFNVQTSTQSALITNMAILLFVRGRFADTVVWCGRIIGDRKSKYRQDIRTFVYLLNLVATFELDDPQLLEAAYRSTYRFLKKQDQVKDSGFESAVLDCMRKLMLEPEEDWPEIWAGFGQYLEQVVNNPEIKISHGLDQLLLYWVQSKLSRRPMDKVLQEREQGVTD